MKQQMLQNSAPDKSKSSRPSTLLTSEENEHVFNLLGRKCQSQATSVVQLYTTEHPVYSSWVKKHTGALCFVKDNGKRSYYFRLYCLLRNEMVWEQEMYEALRLSRPRPYLITFEGQEGIIAFNFAAEDEAERFYSRVNTTISERNRRKEERRRRMRKEPPVRPPAAVPTTNHENSVTLRHPEKIINAQPIIPTVTTNNNFSSSLAQSRPKRGKIRKEDIGAPSGFIHVTHVGWSPDSGFDLSGEEETLKPFLEKAGVSDQQLKDRETRAFIYDFIANHKVVEQMKSEQKREPDRPVNPPPVPVRSHHQNGTSQRLAPPPPPSRPPPLPQTTPPKINSAGPPRPPPIQTLPVSPAPAPVVPQAPAPPPPPPPPPLPPLNIPPPPAPPSMNASVSNGPKTSLFPVEDGRSALLDSIRKGTTLKKVDQASISSSNSGGDDRNELLSEIRKGIQLRPSSTREPGSNRSSGTGSTDALAEALRKALVARGKVIHSSDEDSDNTTTDNDEEWDD